jgi:hypothetical protein
MEGKSASILSSQHQRELCTACTFKRTNKMAMSETDIKNMTYLDIVVARA